MPDGIVAPSGDAEVKGLARSKGKEALETLIGLMGNEDQSIQLTATQALLDRAFGRPAQTLIGSNDDPPHERNHLTPTPHPVDLRQCILHRAYFE